MRWWQSSPSDLAVTPPLYLIYNQMKLILLSVLVAAFQQFASAASSDSKIGFVFELVRHGARAANSDDEPGIFQVPTGMLTSQGMRQRNLLGAYSKQKYIDRYGLLDATYNPNQFYIQSTGIERTLQSSYSELLGIFPPDFSQQATEMSEKGLPPMKIRQSIKNFNNGFIQALRLVPVFAMRPGSPQDDVLLAGCNYMWQVKSYYEQLNSTFSQVYGEVIPEVKDPMGKAFNLDNNTMNDFTFQIASALGDLLVSENFQGFRPRHNFTSDEFHYIRFLQKLYLTIPTSDYARQLTITKELRKPIAALKAAMERILIGNDSSNELKYMIYSSHDDAVSNTLLFLKPYENYFFDIPFASSIVLELHYDIQCQKTSSNPRSCFTVKTFYNNKPLRFSTCLQANQQRGSQSDFCLADDFFSHWDSVKFQGEVEQACKQPFNP